MEPRIRQNIIPETNVSVSAEQVGCRVFVFCSVHANENCGIIWNGTVHIDRFENFLTGGGSGSGADADRAGGASPPGSAVALVVPAPPTRPSESCGHLAQRLPLAHPDVEPLSRSRCAFSDFLMGRAALHRAFQSEQH